MASKTDLSMAQEAFHTALKKSHEMVADLRYARTGHRGGTAEMTAVEPSDEMMSRVSMVPSVPSRRKRTSQVRISTPGMSNDDLQATLLLVRRLRELGDEETEAEIVCLDRTRYRNGCAKFTCEGLQSFWTRTGKEPPPVRHTDGTLEQALESKPLAIFMDPEDAPEGVEDYIRVILTDPYVCLFLRR